MPAHTQDEEPFVGDEVPANDDNPGYAYVGGRWPTDLFGCLKTLYPPV